MKKEVFEYVCRSHMLLSSIPTRYYIGSELVESFEPCDNFFDLVTPITDSLLGGESHINLLLTSQMLMFASVRDKESNCTLVIGPVKSVNISNEEAKEIAISYKMDLIDIEPLKQYFKQINTYSIENFILMISSMNATINDEIIPCDKILKLDSSSSDLNFIRPFENPNHVEKNEGRRFSYEFEKKLNFYIKNGMKDQLSFHLLYNYKDKQGIVGTGAMRQYKNRCISLATIASRAAIDGGSNAPTCYQMCDLYCQKVEQCKTVVEINSVMEKMLNNFCDMVKSSEFAKADNPTIKRTIEYINENIHTKIKVDDISGKLHINPSYLSSKFKKETGISIPNYINKQKINEAKKLLAFSDNSIIDISNYLSFSSQSYFHNQFKKITGKTPKEYRDSI